MTRSARLLVTAVVGAGLVLLGTAVYRSGFFDVRRVEVVGARHLDPAVVVRSLDLESGRRILEDLDGLPERVLAIRGVLAAEVGRRLPGTIVVRITEARPVALVPDSGRLVLMDRRGRALPFDPARAPEDLPLAEQDPVVARALGRVQELDPELFGRIVWARRARGDVALDLAGMRVLIPPAPGVNALRALQAVEHDLAQRGRRFRELDVRFADRVFVRGITS